MRYLVDEPSSTRPVMGRVVWRNLSLDLVAAAGIGVTMAVVGTLLPTIARRTGLPPIGLAALAAAPYVANLLGMFAGRVGPTSTAGLARLRGAGAASLLGLVLIPVAPVMVVVAVLFWASISLGGPYHLRLWGAMYPSRSRGRVVGVLGMGRAAAAAAAALAGGLLADRLGAESAVAIAGLAGLTATIGYLGMRAPAASQPPPFSARGSLRAIRERPALAHLAMAQGLYGGGLIAAAPLLALVYVDRLDLSLGQVGALGLVAAVATTVAFLAWGAVTDRWGALVAMRLGSVLGLVALLTYAIAPDLGFLAFAALAGGIAGASIDVGIASSISDQTDLAGRAAALAGWNAITGARGIVAAFSMSILLQAGIVDVTSGLLSCAVITGAGAVLFFRTRPGVRVDTGIWSTGPLEPSQDGALPAIV
jgi:Major Facilitator Superfamily